MRLKINTRYHEVIFQMLTHLIVFVFYAFDRNETGIQPYKYANFINYAITAAVINYIFLPIFYRKKNPLIFIALVIVIIFISALVEEFFIEKMFFVGPRAETIKMLFAFIDIIPVVTILSGAKFGWDALIKQHQVERLEEAVQESELQFLKSQINPHFLFNNLNNLYSYALAGSEKTPNIILDLSSLMRYMLYECKGKYVPLLKEIEELQNFVNLNELQIEERGQVTFNVEGEPDNFVIAPLVMIVFVENAFKHSQNTLSENINIHIDIVINPNGVMKFYCSNSYQKIIASENSAKGIGLDNVKKRLDIIYPDSHSLNLKASEDIYEVALSLELTKKYDS